MSRWNLVCSWTRMATGSLARRIHCHQATRCQCKATLRLSHPLAFPFLLPFLLSFPRLSLYFAFPFSSPCLPLYLRFLISNTSKDFHHTFSPSSVPVTRLQLLQSHPWVGSDCDVDSYSKQTSKGSREAGSQQTRFLGRNAVLVMNGFIAWRSEWSHEDEYFSCIILS